MITRLNHSAACFCGRDTELSAAEDLLTKRSTGPAMLTVTGDPGIGKSRFLTVLADGLLERGWTPEDDLTPSSLSQAYRLRDESGRILLLIDDAHRLDQQQIRELIGLLRRPAVDRPSVALFYRRRQLAPELATAVLTAAAANATLWIELSPLPYSAVDRLLLPLHGPEVARQIYDAAEGNPAYMAILSARQRSGDVDDALAALRLEITELGTACETIATAMVAWAGPIDPTTAAEISGLSPEIAEKAVDDLLRTHVLRRTDDGLVFRHDLLRQAAEQGIGWQMRRATHRRAADLRRRRGEPVESWAPHVQLSASVGDLQSARWLTRAAAAVRPRSAQLAADWYLAALRVVPESSAHRARRGRLLLGQAEALVAAGRFVEGRDAAHQALHLLPPHGWRVLRTALMLAAFSDRCLGRFDEALALLTRAHAVARPGEVALAMADIHILMGEFAMAAQYAEQAEAEGSPARFAARAGTLAVARYLNGDIAGAQRVTEELGTLIDAAADHELMPLLPGLSWLGWTELFLGHHREAERRQGRAVALARRTRHNHSLIMLLVGRGTALRHLGRLDEAGACYEEAYAAALTSGSDVLTTLTLTMQARLEQSRGDIDAALGLAKAAADIGRRTTGWFAAHAAALYAQIRLDSDDAEGCVDEIVQACGGRDLIRIDPAGRPHWYEALCRAALAIGDLQDARDWADRARRAAGILNLPAAHGYSMLAASHVAAALGRLQESEDFARRAAQQFDGTGDWLDSVRTKLFAAVGTGSESLLKQVLRQAEQLGAEPLRAAALRELERLRERHARRVDEGPLSVLTLRERQVAELVAAGSTNRQIAGELFLSVKTVERHLARIFTRLDISSRAKLAAMIATEAN